MIQKLYHRRFAKKYSVTLPTIYNWRQQFKKRSPNMSAHEIHHIIAESNKIGIQATCAKHGLKESTLYNWQYKYLNQKQSIKPNIDDKVVEDKFAIVKVSRETEDELAKLKEMCLALTFENFTLKNIIKFVDDRINEAQHNLAASKRYLGEAQEASNIKNFGFDMKS